MKNQETPMRLDTDIAQVSVPAGGSQAREPVYRDTSGPAKSFGPAMLVAAIQLFALSWQPYAVEHDFRASGPGELPGSVKNVTVPDGGGNQARVGRLRHARTTSVPGSETGSGDATLHYVALKRDEFLPEVGRNYQSRPRLGLGERTVRRSRSGAEQQKMRSAQFSPREERRGAPRAYSNPWSSDDRQVIRREDRRPQGTGNVWSSGTRRSPDVWQAPERNGSRYGQGSYDAGRYGSDRYAPPGYGDDRAEPPTRQRGRYENSGRPTYGNRVRGTESQRTYDDRRFGAERHEPRRAYNTERYAPPPEPRRVERYDNRVTSRGFTPYPGGDERGDTPVFGGYPPLNDDHGEGHQRRDRAPAGTRYGDRRNGENGRDGYAPPYYAPAPGIEPFPAVPPPFPW